MSSLEELLEELVDAELAGANPTRIRALEEAIEDEVRRLEGE